MFWWMGIYRVSLKKCPMFGRLKYVTFIRFKTTFTAINSSRGSAGTNLWPTHIQKCFVWFGLAMEDDIINAKQEGEVQTWCSWFCVTDLRRATVTWFTISSIVSLWHFVRSQLQYRVSQKKESLSDTSTRRRRHSSLVRLWCVTLHPQSVRGNVYVLICHVSTCTCFWLGFGMSKENGNLYSFY